MGQILQYFSSEPPVCKNEEDLLSYAWNSVRLKCVDAVVKNEVTLKMRGMYGCSENNGIKVHKEYTPLVIACMYRDLQLATELIKRGADVNLCPKENRFASEEGVPPLYYATNMRDAEIVKLLFSSGADVNGLKGRQQSLNLQEPTEELYSIFDIMRRTYSRSAENCGRPQASLPVLVELYLEAGAKLNTTRWGPCLFYGLEMGNILQHFLSGLPETFLMFCSLEMRNILQHFLSGPPEYEDALLSYAWNSLRLKSVDTLIINKVTLRMRMFGYTEENGMKIHKEYTPLVIACMYRDLKLATELIKLGADVNLQVRPKDMQFPSEEGVPALYFATNLGDTEIVKLLLNSEGQM